AYLEKALGVDEEIALKDSCRIEHVISNESFGKIKTWLQENE
ncbi:MAG: metal-dependent transcriptional regulator, partial [Clostridiales Family XIII bacterium]|nr:metal-dependent transcriptional regulator [Clostridiales Family XIII bacterium]